MKLFKILFISIISILIFQSQLYGINLRCDFKQRLFGINEKEYNGVTCGWYEGDKSFCDKNGCNICKVEDNGELLYWISEVIIKNKDVEIVREPNDYNQDTFSDEDKRGYYKQEKEKLYLVESEVHHKSVQGWSNERYIFVINRTTNSIVSQGNKVELYTLWFRPDSKLSILTEYVPYWNSIYTNWTRSYYGKCEEI